MIKGIEDRNYQIELFSKSVEKNTLIVLPTGLGKTIIILYLTAYHLKKNDYNKIVISTPTKPLVRQITQTLKDHLEIDPDLITEVSGAIKPEDREELYEDVRVIVGTPQTIDNDMVLSRIDLKNISLLCLDEAHRTTGNYAYVKIINGFLDNGLSPHIVGFTATPGNKKEQIIEVLTNLRSEQLLYKSPNDPDIEPYVSYHKPENIFVKLPELYEKVLDLINEYIKEIAYEIRKLGVDTGRYDYITRKDALAMQKKAIALMQQDREKGKLLNFTPNLIRAIHLKDVIETQGFPQAHETIQNWIAKKKKGKTLKEFLYRINENGISHILKEQQIPHPKLEKLFELLDNQNLEGESKIIIFSNYRNTVRFLEEELKHKDYPCDIFLGQSSGSRKKGMSQKEQLEVLKRFKHDDLHILISTSVGEEGLDVGSCDLVVFYDSVPSVIRSIQRTGRGRKRQSKVIRLITKNTKDEGMFYATKHREKKIDRLLRHEVPDLLKEKQKKERTTGLLHHFKSDKKQKNQENDQEEDKVFILVDSREAVSIVPRALKKEGAKIEASNLDVGDYQISERCIIERKTTVDFVDSIIDGRLFDQSATKLGTVPKPIIIIEGTWSQRERNIPMNTIMGALAALVINFNFGIIYSQNGVETAKIIYHLAKREQKKHEKPIKKIQTETTTSLNDIQEAMLAQIPGLNTSKVQDLLKQFKSIKEITLASEKELAETKGIGKTLARRIAEALRKEYTR